MPVVEVVFGLVHDQRPSLLLKENREDGGAALARRELADAPEVLLPLSDLQFDLKVVVLENAHEESELGMLEEEVIAR